MDSNTNENVVGNIESQLADASKTELIGYILDTINQTQSDSCKNKCTCGSDSCGGCGGCGD